MSLLKSYTALASGTISIPVDQASAGSFPFVRDNIIAGTVTLSGGLVVSPSGTPTTGQRVVITWNASVTPSGNTITIFGETVPTELAARNFVAECLWDGTGGPWVVNILPDFAGVGIVAADRIAANAVTTAKIADDAVTLAKVQDVAANSVLVRDANSSGVLTEKALATTQILIGDGTGFTAAALSGDVTMTNAGVVTLAANSVITADITDANVTVEKCEADLLYDMISVRIDSKSAAAVGNVNITMPYKCDVTHVVIGVLEPTLNDTFTAVLKNNGGASMGSIDVPTSMAIGNKATLGSSGSPLSSNNSFLRSENLLIEGSKVTKSSGAYNVCIYTLRK